MLPSMRYETRKLSELYHRKQSFKNHRLSVVKIKNKSNSNHSQRSSHLEQLRDRMHSAFNYTQKVKSKHIKHENHKLFVKCFCGKNSLTTTNPQLIDKDRMQKKLQEKSLEKSLQSQNKPEKISSERRFVLRNHRQSPITKMTAYDRTKENLRLAIKINRPCPSINTNKLQKVHDQSTKYKERIMRYNNSSLKSSKYLEKRLSTTFQVKKDLPSSTQKLEWERNSVSFRKNESNPFALTQYQ